ncbi:unnamed protein product [Owenia fusiformis]|nr:unnamed protein product [Owenia fusiformis]
MIEHFLPIIQRSGEDCRIILVSSLAHGNCTFVKDDIEGKNKTKDMSFKLYSNSKGYQVMHMYSLYSRLQRRSVQNIGVFSLHPGYVQTELARDISKVFQTINIVSRKLGISINREKGAFTTLYCSVNPDLKGTSGYYDNCKLTTPSATTRNKEYQEILESYTRECLKDDLPKDGEVAGYVDTYYTDRQPTC